MLHREHEMGRGVVHNYFAIHRLLGFCGSSESFSYHAQLTMFAMRSHHSNHSNQKPTQPIPDPLTPDGKQSAFLGDDPGELIASLPALLGFAPKDSLVFIGLTPVRMRDQHTDIDMSEYTPTANDTIVTFHVGPVVRSDFEPTSMRQSIETLCHATSHLPNFSVMVLVVTESAERAVEIFDAPRAELLSQPQEEGLRPVDIYSCHWAEGVEEDQRWAAYDCDSRLWLDEGDVPPTADNPLTLHSSVNGNLKFSDRKDMERWLNKKGSPVKFTDPRPHNSPADLLIFTKAVRAVFDGWITVEEASQDVKTIRCIARLCQYTPMQKFLIAASIGMPSPVVRSLLAHTARRTDGAVRHKVMYVLIQVLVGNGEGVAAFHTAHRGLSEALDPECWQDFQVLQLSLKAGFALGIVQDKTRLASDIIQDYRHLPEGAELQDLSAVMDWDAIEHINNLDVDLGGLGALFDQFS